MIGTITWVSPCAPRASGTRQLRVRLAAWLLVVASAVLPMHLSAQQVTAALRNAVQQSQGRVIIRISQQGGAALRAEGDPLLSDTAAAAVARNLDARYAAKSRGQALRFGMLFAEVSADQLNALAADPSVASIEADFVSDPAELSNEWPSLGAVLSARRADAVGWGIAKVNAPAAWAAGVTGAGVRVGIMDSGIDIDHPDLGVSGGFDFTTSSGSPSAYDDNIGSCNGHGTHVAGIVAARQNGSGVIGVAPDAQLYSLKVFEIISGSCKAWGSNQIAALDWAVANGLKVVSISIGGTTFSQSYQDAVNTATAAGVVVVAAAGNNSSNILNYPGAYSGATAVGSVNGSNIRSSWSNTGANLWLAAPGEGIVSTMPGGGTGSKSGTSMATPHVSGLAALYFQINPGASVTQVRNALRDAAIDIDASGWDAGTGWGLAQAAGIGSAPPPPPPVPLAMSVSPTSRKATVQAGTAAPADSATITLSGDNSATTAWSATKKKAWTTLTTATGTGSGKVRWNRSTSGLAAGTYVDTITVAASGVSSRTVIDTLVVTTAPVSLAMSVSPTSRKATVQAGTAAPTDSATITLSGDNSASTAWSATKKKAWTTLTTATGTGSGKVRWNRSTSGLAAGTYVDTITVAASGVSSRTVIDTLVVTTAPVSLAMSVSPTSRKATVQAGTAAPADSATITLSGDNSATTAWSATKRKSWTTLTTATGSGSGKVRWNRSTSGLAAGTYVDTITVAASGVSSRTVIDTLVVTTAAVPLAMSVSPTSRKATVQAGTAAPADSATITLSGDNSASTAWSATKKKAWTTLTTATGTGSGKVRWNRSTSGLAAGTYVDTITVAASGVSLSTVIDTLVVTTTPVPLAMSVSPTSRKITAQTGTAVGGDSATVTLSGDNSATKVWSATKKKAWTTLTTATGSGSGKVKWNRSTSGLAAGTYVDTITVAASGVSSRTVIDTLVVTQTTTTARLNKGGGKTRTIKDSKGKSASVGQDTTTVTASVDGQSTDGTSAPKWVATTGASWIRFVNGATPTTGAIVWTRDASQLPAGQYIDSVVVSLEGNPAMRGTYTDTVVVVVIPDPSPTSAVDELVKGNRLTTDQRDFFDATGNRNGRFDLGDFLAWVDRNRISLSTSVTSQLAELKVEP